MGMVSVRRGVRHLLGRFGAVADGVRIVSAEMQVLPVRKYRIVNDYTKRIEFETPSFDEAVERAEQLRKANTEDEITLLAEVDA